MTILAVATKNSLATSYGVLFAYGALATSTPTTTAGTEPSGGSPAYARIILAWGSATAGVITGTAQVFNVPSGATIVGYQGFSAITAGTYIDGATVTSQAFASQGTYTVTPTYTQT